VSNEEITRSFDYTTGGLQQAFQPLPCLTIVYHPDASRVGQRSVLRGHSAIELSRVHLSFGHRNQTAQVLAEPHISRAPITIQPASDGSLRLSLPKPGYRLRIDGVPALRCKFMGPKRVPRCGHRHGAQNAASLCREPALNPARASRQIESGDNPERPVQSLHGYS
jgi:hypothetical protein